MTVSRQPVKYFYRLRDERALSSTSRQLLSVSIYSGVVPRSELTDKESRADDLGDYKKVDPGDIVINRMSAYQGALGIAEASGVVSPEYIVLRALPGTEARFLTYLFKSQWFISEMASRVRGIGSTSQGNVRTPRINPEDLGGIQVSFPVFDVQRAIADFLDAETARLDALVAKKRHLIATLNERLVQQVRIAVTGGADDRAWSPGPFWLGPVPRSWEPRKIAWFNRTGSGTTPESGNTDYYDEEGLPWVTTSELRETTIRDTSQHVSKRALAEYSALKAFPPGTLLVAMYGATVGRLGLLGVTAALNQACCAILEGEVLSQRFLFWWLWSHRAQLLESAQGAGQPNISQEVIRSLRVPAPSMSVQERIAASIDLAASRIDRIRSRLQDQVRLLVEHRQALITATVTGELEIPGVAA